MAKRGLTPGDITRIAKMVEKLIQSRIISVTRAVIAETETSYTLCTTVTPDSSVLEWFGPVTIGTDCVVTIGASSVVEISDQGITLNLK